MTKYEKMTYEEEEEEKKVIAKIIYNSPFLSGIQKLTKTQLVILVNELTERLDAKINLDDDFEMDERDFKDIAWDRKCLIIKTLNPDFFKEVEDE